MKFRLKKRLTRKGPMQSLSHGEEGIKNLAGSSVGKEDVDVSRKSKIYLGD